MKSLAHSPDIIGLFFSILNQFTSTSTFLNDGQLINDVIFKKSTLNEMLSEKYNTSCNEVRENNKE